MTRKLKAIALALAAVFAMSALAASSAHATLTSSSSHTILSGAQEGSLKLSAGSGFGTVTCTTVTFSGTAAGTETSSLVVTPAIANCGDSLGRKIHIAKNTLTSTITNGTSHATGEAVTNATSGGSVVCTTTIKPQTNSGFAFENLGGTKGVKINLNSSNAVTTTSGGFFGCGGTDGEHKNGTVEGTVLVTGSDTTGAAASISID